MGFDCLHWAKQGHAVTYFELPGYGPRFATKLFDGAGVKIPMLTDPSAIPLESFDAITCLDVLEHVLGEVVPRGEPRRLLPGRARVKQRDEHHLRKLVRPRALLGVLRTLDLGDL